MKNLFLVLVILIGSTVATFGQEKINVDDLIGYWEPDKHSAQLIFWKDTFGKLQVVEFSNESGAVLDLISLTNGDSSEEISTVFKENVWSTKSTFTFLDKNTLQCVISGDTNSKIIYTKVK